MFNTLPAGFVQFDSECYSQLLHAVPLSPSHLPLQPKSKAKWLVNASMVIFGMRQHAEWILAPVSHGLLVAMAGEPMKL